MTLRSLQFITLLALTFSPVLLFAQAEISSKEEERLEALAREDSEWYAPKNSLTVGFRVLGSGAKVQFGNLGSVPNNLAAVAVAGAGSGTNRTYNNGYVNVDVPRSNETDGDGGQSSTQGGRYNVYATGTTTVVGDYLSYTNGLSRNWSYSSANQALVQPGYIAMSNYSTTSDGDVMNKKMGATAGVELQLSHVMGKLSKRTEWSFVAGLTLNGINNKTAGDVHSTLNVTYDYYYLNGQAAPAVPSTGPYVGGITNVVTGTDGIPREVTVPVSAVPVTIDGAVKSKPFVGAATVHGKWQVKGSYFMLRVGPSMHSQLTERFGVSASLGVAGAYAGTHYTADESFEIPDVGTTISTSEFGDTTKFLTGYYADVNLDWAANERTGLFGGLSAQKLGDYGQALGTRTARVDLGTSVGLRGGVSIKF